MGQRCVHPAPPGRRGVVDIQVSGHSYVSLEQDYVCGGDLKLGPTGRVWILHNF